MPRQPIPERAPVTDQVAGAIVQVDGACALAIGAADLDTPPAPLWVRYGVRLLGKPHLSIVPGLVAIDYGELLTGDEAWDFLVRHSNLYPRAEVFGFRDDGRDDMLYVKQLDLALPMQVLVYTDPQSSTPAARPSALIAPEALAAALPQRVLDYLPRFETVAQWRAGMNS